MRDDKKYPMMHFQIKTESLYHWNARQPVSRLTLGGRSLVAITVQMLLKQPTLPPLLKPEEGAEREQRAVEEQGLR